MPLEYMSLFRVFVCECCVHHSALCIAVVEHISIVCTCTRVNETLSPVYIYHFGVGHTVHLEFEKGSISTYSIIVE